MLFSKLSIFVAATLAALTVAASVPQSCPNGRSVKCCLEKRAATAADKDLAMQKLNEVIAINNNVWLKCTTLASPNVCTSQAVCCDKVAADGSIAVRCTNA